MFAVIIISGLFNLNVSAAVYFVRADGAALTKELATGPVTDRSHNLSLSAFNDSTFFPGDIVYFSSRGGDFRSKLVIPSSGDANNNVVYEGIAGEIPLINVSANTTSSGGIIVSNKDLITIRNFKIRGSGGFDAFSVWGASGTSGYGVKVHNVNVLSSYGASSGDNDCFSVNNTSEVIFYDISAAGCREASPPYTKSHQGITGHTSSKYHVIGGIFTDSNFVAVNTLNTIGRLDNISASGIYMHFFGVAVDGTSNASLTVVNSVLNADAGAGLASNNSEGALITIKDSDISVTKSRPQLVKGGVLEFLNNDFLINDAEWRLHAYGGDILFKGNNISINDVDGYFCGNASERSSNIIAKGNTFTASGSFSDNLFLFRNPSIAGRLSYNIFNGFVSDTGVVKIRASSKAPIVNNNTIFNSGRSGEFISLERSGNESSDQALLLFNNIFSGVENVISAAANVMYEAINNIYFNSQYLAGSGSIVLDPGFVSPGIDYRLQNTSPAINSGTDRYALGLPADVTISGLPDIGAKEYKAVDNLCGKPAYDKRVGKGYYIWKDCTYNTWHVRVTAGGDSGGVEYAGSFTFESNVSSIDVSTFSFENNDDLTFTSQYDVIYLMEVWNNGEDGLDFLPASNICFQPVNLSLPVYFGANKQIITAPFNFDTLQSCGIAPVDECGEPDYDLGSESAQFIWEDCLTGIWSIKASAGVHKGVVSSNSGFTVLEVQSFENSDVFDSTVNGFTYEMRVGSPWWDQINFLPENESGTCFDASSSGLPVYFGKNRREIGTLDLETLNGC